MGKRVVFVVAPHAELKQFDRDLEEYFGLPKKPIFQRQLEHHHDLAHAIMEKYPGAELHMMSDDRVSGVEVYESWCER